LYRSDRTIELLRNYLSSYLWEKIILSIWNQLNIEWRKIFINKKPVYQINQINRECAVKFRGCGILFTWYQGNPLKCLQLRNNPRRMKTEFQKLYFLRNQIKSRLNSNQDDNSNNEQSKQRCFTKDVIYQEEKKISIFYEKPNSVKTKQKVQTPWSGLLCLAKKSKIFWQKNITYKVEIN